MIYFHSAQRHSVTPVTQDCYFNINATDSSSWNSPSDGHIWQIEPKSPDVLVSHMCLSPCLHFLLMLQVSLVKRCKRLHLFSWKGCWTVSALLVSVSSWFVTIILIFNIITTIIIIVRLRKMRSTYMLPPSPARQCCQRIKLPPT